MWVLIYQQLNPSAVHFQCESDYPENQREDAMLHTNSKYPKKQTSSEEVQAFQKYILLNFLSVSWRGYESCISWFSK